MIFIYGPVLRSVEFFTISPRVFKPSFHALVIIPISQMRQREAQRKERLKPVNGGKSGPRTHRPYTPAWASMDSSCAFPNLSLEEEEISCEKVPGKSAWSAWRRCLFLLSSSRSDFSSAQRAFVSSSASHRLPPIRMSRKLWKKSGMKHDFRQLIGAFHANLQEKASL